MKVVSKKVSPPYSVLLVSDRNGGRIPDELVGLFASTDSCIAVGCKSEMDGLTEVVIGHRSEFSSAGIPAFVGVISTPSKELVVATIEGEPVVAAAVPGLVTTLSFWLNDRVEPDQIVVGFE